MTGTLDDFAAETYETNRFSIIGKPQLGNIVTVEYSSSRSDKPVEASGELLYTHDPNGEIDSLSPELEMYIHDTENGRILRFSMEEGPVTAPLLRSLKDRRSGRGRRIGKLISVRFTNEEKNVFSDSYRVLNEVEIGDTIRVNGVEYGVARNGAYSTVLTRGEQQKRWSISIYPQNDEPEFSITRPTREQIELDEIEVGRFHKEEDTEGFFPSPHGVREGEQVEVTFEDEAVTGLVTDVTYFSPDNDELSTVIGLDDGREIKMFNNMGKERAMIKPKNYDVMEDEKEWKEVIGLQALIR